MPKHIYDGTDYRKNPENAKAIGSGSAGLFKTDGPQPTEKPAFPQLANALYYQAIQGSLSPATRAALDQAGVGEQVVRGGVVFLDHCGVVLGHLVQLGHPDVDLGQGARLPGREVAAAPGPVRDAGSREQGGRRGHRLLLNRSGRPGRPGRQWTLTPTPPKTTVLVICKYFP